LESNVAVGLASIIVIGIAAQWVGWRLAIPSILILLLAGLIAGPVTGFIDPDELFGDLLLPVVSLSVAIVLFEGGLSLKVSELRHSGRAVVNLVTGGVLITWVLAAGAAYLIFDIELRLAILLGAILTVTGPTVIGPLLRHIRPSGKGATTLKWEGILNDPIGALLAVLVFEAIVSGELGGSFGNMALEFLKSIGVGAALGAAGGALTVALLHRYWAPEYLHEVISLSLVIAVFTIANELAHESGLLAVTVMGVLLANQKFTSIKHIVEFKENLRVVLVSALFIILAARIELDELGGIAWQAAAYVAALVFVARPVAVFLSTTGAGLSLRDRAFVSWMAPRGIVAAAITAAFALGLADAGFVEAEKLVPIMFAVIVGTVVVYGLTAGPVARALGLARHRHEGVVIVGAHSWAREIAAELKGAGFRAVLIDPDLARIAAARSSELEAHFASAISDSVLDEIDLQGLGRLIALTANDEMNSLACLHFAEAFSRNEVYQLMLEQSESQADHAPVRELRGRILFDKRLTFAEMDRLFAAGAAVVTSEFTEEFTFRDFQTRRSGRSVPLFLLRGGQELEVVTTRQLREARRGDRLVWLHLPEPALDEETAEPEKPA
jgi:NhaP-type Na+/H+ or K+/H+ antiporter